MTLFSDTFTFKNGQKLKNRVVMAPMTTWSGNEDGTISDAELKYYGLRSKDVSMVITATTYLEPHGKGFEGQFCCGTDDYLESMTDLAKAIHAGGAVAILQVFHAGRKASPDDMPDGITRSASAVSPNRDQSVVPQAMTLDEIESLKDSYYQVVIRAIKAGFDGIEIHGANTYLLQQYVSPHSNRRDDVYGGSVEKRLRLPMEVIKRCDQARVDAGNQDFILGYRFSPEENYDVGITLEDTKVLVDNLCEMPLDYLHISLQHYKATSMRDKTDTELVNSRVIEWIDGRMTYISLGSIKNHDQANELLDMGADLVAVGRQLISEPDLYSRWLKEDKNYKKYSLSNYQAIEVPDELHKRIEQFENWIETVE